MWSAQIVHWQWNSLFLLKSNRIYNRLIIHFTSPLYDFLQHKLNGGRFQNLETMIILESRTRKERYEVWQRNLQYEIDIILALCEVRGVSQNVGRNIGREEVVIPTACTKHHSTKTVLTLQNCHGKMSTSLLDISAPLVSLVNAFYSVFGISGRSNRTIPHVPKTQTSLAVFLKTAIATSIVHFKPVYRRP